MATTTKKAAAKSKRRAVRGGNGGAGIGSPALVGGSRVEATASGVRRKQPSRTGAALKVSRNGVGGRSNAARFSKSKDEAKRKKIAATLDASTFYATVKQTSKQTAAEWSTPY